MQVAGNVRGVVDVWDEIAIVGPPPDARDVKDAIMRAFDRSAKLDANALTVETSNGTVTVKGTVLSWADHQRGDQRRLGGAGSARRARPDRRLLLEA
jgi:osmotically-inducible protein OsmY